MLRVAMVFTVVLIAVSHQKNPQDIFNDEHCLKLFHSIFCCEVDVQEGKLRPKNSKTGMNDYKKCMELPSDTITCEEQICLAALDNLASTNGTINKPKIMEIYESIFDQYENLVKDLRDNCIDGDLSIYGQNECDIIKLDHCTTVQVFKNCDNWSKDKRCEGIKEAATECLGVFP